MLTGRSSANFLTKLTAIIAGLFLANSLLLAILSGKINKSLIINNTEIEDLIDNNENDSSKPIVPDTE